jgi:thiamine biosynthesis lipoprotein
MKRIFSLALMLLLLAGCAPTVGDTGDTQQFFAMDTVMSITVYDGQKGAAEAAMQRVSGRDALLSRTRAESEIARVNQNAGTGVAVALSDDVYSILQQAVGLSDRTDGMFDPTIAPVMDAWGFTKSEYRVPGADELAELLPLVNADALVLKDRSAMLPEKGMELDLGAIAKGYAGDQCAQLLSSYGVTSALVALGGNITAIGAKPDGTNWRVAVRDPNNEDSYLCVLPLQDRTASTSGGYERYFEQDGVIYHHIIDPDVGYPARSGLKSVTVVSASGTTADALSTALFVMGEEKALELWRESSDFEVVLVRDDNKVLFTDGLESGLDFQGGDHGYTYEIVRR